MRKIITKFFNRRTLPIILLPIILVVTSFFLIPVSNSKLVASTWCGLGGNWLIRSLAFVEDGSLQFTKIYNDLSDTHWNESGTWERDGRKIKINSIELDNPRSHYRTFQLSSFGWGTRLWAYDSDFERSENSPSLLIINPCN